MSRCFPYLRPNLEDVPLIEPIKSEKESRKERKDRRKERKREKKERKERKRSREDHGSLEPTEHSQKKRKHDEGKDCLGKARDDASEQLEKSSVTEEIGLPLSTHSPYDSDRSQNTKQRGNPTAAAALPINHNNGLVFRVRLPLVKKQDGEPHFSSEDPCFSGRVETPIEGLHCPSRSHSYRSADLSESVFNQEAADAAITLSSSQQRHSPSGRVEESYKQDAAQPVEQPPSSLLRCINEQNVAEVAAVADTPSASHRRLSRAERREQRYKDVVMNWNPQPFPCELSDDTEQDWLFGSQKEKLADPAVKTYKVSTEAAHGNAAPVSFQPRACYIPEIDMYALPYVAPF